MFQNIFHRIELFIKKLSFETFFISGFCFLFFVYVFYVTRIIPKNFPVGEVFLVQEDETLKSISIRLENEHIINSALLFRAWVSLKGKDRKVNLGQYKFNKPLVLGAVVKKLVGIPDMPLIQLTIPEGSTDIEIANNVHNLIPNISAKDFLSEVKIQNASGRLFPETYFLLPSKTAKEIVSLLFNTFNQKYKNYIISNQTGVAVTEKKFYKIGIGNKDFDDKIIILASIIQGEARTENDMRIVSGILWNRLNLDMALQVDVAKVTYNKKGIPNTPVNNAGLMAINAVFSPIKTDYLFYLTGKDGKMYYAKNFTEHKKNISKYLQ